MASSRTTKVPQTLSERGGEDFESLPIIDLSALRSPTLEQRRQLAREVDQACKQVGFFYVTVRIRQISK